MLRSRFYRAMPRLQKEFPTARWIFFTLTVKNCEVTDLSETLDLMLKAWQKLVQRKEFRPVLGWLRTTEVTRGKDGTAHPHFHVMMMVPPSWFSHHYVKHERWVQIWKESLQVDYTPVVDIRAIRETVDEADDRIRGAILETLKYSVKPSDMTADPEWLEELAHQTHKRRFFVSGGVLSDALREEEESDEELALADGEAEQSDDGWRMAFGWDPGSRRYRRDPHFDSPAGEVTGIRRGGSSPPSRMGQGLGG